MKNLKILSLMTAAIMLLAGCADDNYSDMDPWGGGSTPNGGQGGNNATGDDLEAFDISFDTSALNETENIPTDENDEAYDDYAEHSTFSRQITVNFNGSSATIDGATDGIDIAIDGAHVTVVIVNKGMEFILTGSTTDGSFKSYSDYKFKLTLNGVSITNPNGPAINNQSHKRTFVELEDGTSNSLTDGSSYTDLVEDEDCKACFFSEGQIIVSGSGTLNITGNYKNGLCSDDYIRLRAGNIINVTATKSNGIKSNDGVLIDGGVLNIGVSGTAAKGISSDAHVEINGGRTTIITSGNGEWDSDENDTNACAGIKADSIFTMNSGELYIKSTGSGGKGINGDQTVTFNGGTVKILTTGSRYTYGSQHSSAKGIKGDGDVVINDGSIKVRASGGEGSEGIESKCNVTINGGTVEVSSYDDAINVSNKGYALNITNGSTYAYSTNNDAVDSNGSITISGGILIAAGASQPEGGIDSDNTAIVINGGVVIGLGGENSQVSTSSKQMSLVSGNQVSASTIMAVTCAGNNVLAYKVPRSFSQMIISSPKFSSGSTWSITSGASVSGGTTFHGLTISGTTTSGTTVASGTLSSTVTYSNTRSGGPGGGNPGGGWH